VHYNVIPWGQSTESQACDTLQEVYWIAGMCCLAVLLSHRYVLPCSSTESQVCATLQEVNWVTGMCYLAGSQLSHRHVLPCRKSTESQVRTTLQGVNWVTGMCYLAGGQLSHRHVLPCRRSTEPQACATLQKACWVAGKDYLAEGLVSEAVDWVWCVLAAQWTTFDSTPNDKHTHTSRPSLSGSFTWKISIKMVNACLWPSFPRSPQVWPIPATNVQQFEDGWNGTLNILEPLNVLQL